MSHLIAAVWKRGCVFLKREGGDYVHEMADDNMIADATAAGELYKAKCAAIGSNYMLNVGPDSLGRFPVAAIEILDGLAKERVS